MPSQTCAGGATAGADSARRLNRSSQSSARSRRYVTGQQPLETPAGRATQRAEGILRRQSVMQLGIGVVHRSMQSLSWIKPRRIQLFTVPSGAPSRPATSAKVKLS